jgi:hypothetical protein
MDVILTGLKDLSGLSSNLIEEELCTRACRDLMKGFFLLARYLGGFNEGRFNGGFF